MKPVYVRGLGLWTPGHASPEAWCREDPDPAVEVPPGGLLAGSLRRRATPLTRMALAAFDQAITRSGCDPATAISVWANAHGEHSTAVRLLAMMQRGEGKVSPTHFHNSVHNTASGYASIAAGNSSPSTTLTGGGELVVASFLEAVCHLEASARDVVVVLSDEALCPPFDREDARTALALAFCLSTASQGAQALLSELRRDAIAPLKLDPRFGRLHVSAALPLLERIVVGRPGTVALEFEGESTGAVWCVDVELVGP